MTFGYCFSVFLCLALVAGVNYVNAQGHGYQNLTRARILDALHIDYGTIWKGGIELSDSEGLSGYMTKSAQGTRSSSTEEGQSKIVQISPRARDLTFLLAQNESSYSNYGSSRRADIAVKSGTTNSRTRAIGRGSKVLKSIMPISKSIIPSRPVYKSGFAPRAGSRNPLSFMSGAGLHGTMKQDPELKARLLIRAHHLSTKWQSHSNGSVYGSYKNNGLVDMPPLPLNPAIDISFPPQEINPNMYEAAQSIQEQSSSMRFPAASGPTDDIDLSHETRGYAHVTRLKLAVDLHTPRGFNHRVTMFNGIHSRKPATSSSDYRGFTKARGTGVYKPSFEAAEHSESPLERFHVENYGPRGFRPQGKFKPFQHSPPTSGISPVRIMMVTERGAEPDDLSKSPEGMALSNEKSDQDMKLGPYGFSKAYKSPSPTSTTVLPSDSPSRSTSVPTSTNSPTNRASPHTEFTPAEMLVPLASISPPEGHPGSHGISFTHLTEQLDPKMVAPAGTDLELNMDDDDDDDDDYSGEEQDKNPK
ncbi:hypothetical protein UPYG_G00080270 [Umbra pygmaea]|uniref:Uncharacterized protein n=1 Tax=Umbra pygmaea TaxID=75934 RepID=A0ABD0XE04_UMBPY